MRIAVLISGVADAKRPIDKPVSGQWIDLIATPTTPFKLSPFDEAALEVALKMRDRRPDTSVHVIVTDGAVDVAFMKSVASYRPDTVVGIRVKPEHRGDARWLSHHVSKVMPADQQIDLWLIGREHGDMDDGVVPVTLAEIWKLPFLSLVLTVKGDEQSLHSILVERMASDQIESILCPLPAVLSVSNDKSNRLRHPLMKNVMLAKQQKIEVLEPQADAAAQVFAQRCPISSIAPLDIAARGLKPCKMLEGDVEAQVLQLAQHLDRWRQSGMKNVES